MQLALVPFWLYAIHHKSPEARTAQAFQAVWMPELCTRAIYLFTSSRSRQAHRYSAAEGIEASGGDDCRSRRAVRPATTPVYSNGISDSPWRATSHLTGRENAAACCHRMLRLKLRPLTRLDSSAGSTCKAMNAYASQRQTQAEERHVLEAEAADKA